MITHLCVCVEVSLCTLFDVQFGLSKLTSDDGSSDVKLTNELVDAALERADDSAEVIDVSASTDKAASSDAAGSGDAKVSVLEIDAVASQLQDSLYGYEGKQYNPNAWKDEDDAIMVRVLQL